MSNDGQTAQTGLSLSWGKKQQRTDFFMMTHMKIRCSYNMKAVMKELRIGENGSPLVGIESWTSWLKNQ